MDRFDSQSTDPPEHPTVSSLLLGGAKQMDPVAWSRLVSTFGPIVYRWCRSSGIRESDAADVVQEVFASVARGIATFERQKEQGSFRSWLATITRNRVRDHFRRHAQREAAAGGTEALQRLEQHAESLDSTITPQSAAAAIARQVLQSVQTEFEPSTWNVFCKTVIEGQSTAEVAAATGLSNASIYQAKSRVLRRLRQRLAEMPD
jgi:RNA polymerase sigma-70 factor, ECF subfamily